MYTSAATPPLDSFLLTGQHIKKMSVIDENLFSGAENIGTEDLQRAKIVNFTGDVKTVLGRFGWSGLTLCASVGLALSADNSSVEKSVFLVNGPVENKTILVEGTKVWPEADSKVRLAITLKNGSVFTFSAGGLASDIVAQEEVEHGFFAMEEGRQPAPILAADYEDWGIGQFALKMLCTVSKNTSERTGVIIKHAILLFPLGRETLLEKYEAAQSPAWPGIRLTDGHMPLFPKAETAWKCPVLPLIKRAVEVGGQEVWPGAAEMRRAVAATMGAAVKAVTARTASSLLNKWQRLNNNPTELMEERGDLVWPPAELPSDNGKKETQ